jgi:hypothetical protein
MSDYDHHEYAVSIPEIDQATLEAGLIARILAVPSDYFFLYTLLRITPDCFQGFTARRVYSACVQSIANVRADQVTRPVNPVEDLNISETDEALSYIRKAIQGGYPADDFVAICLLELRDRSLLRRLAEQEPVDEEWERISAEYADDPDEMPW